MESKLVIAGYFGCGNLGDDAILAGLLNGLAHLPVRPVVLSGAPERTYRTFSVSAVPRKDLGAVAEALQGAEALVLGGGSLFQDVTSAASAMYYAKIVSMGKKATGRVVMLGQGFGPLNGFFGKKAASAALRQADAIAVRDEASGRLAASLGAKCEIKLTADLAWLANPDRTEGGSFGVADQQTVGLAPRPWGKSKAVAEPFMQFVRKLSADGHLPMMLPFDETQDMKLIEEMGKLGMGNPSVLKGIKSPAAMMARIERMSAVVAMRYHGAIFAAKAGIPPILVSYDPKVSALSSILEVPSAIPTEGLSADRLWAAYENMEKNKERHVTRLAAIRPSLEEKARENVELLCRCVPSLRGEGRTVVAET